MIVNLNKTISAICPICGEAVKKQITPFDIMPEYSLTCSFCKNEVMAFEYMQKEHEYKITENCFICDMEHIFRVGYNAMWAQGIFSLGCQNSGVDICYIGSDEETESAMRELDAQLESMMQSTPQPQITELGGVLKDAFDILNGLLAEGKIICLCGEKNIGAFISPKGITLTCAACGSFEVIKMQNDEDLEKLKKRKSILLK